MNFRNKHRYLTWEKADNLISSNTEEIYSSDQICPHPILSVCIITYNHNLFLRQAIDSVIMQEANYSFEIVVADDDSKDGTTNIVLEYQRLYPEILKVLLSKDNLGKHTNNGRLNMIRSMRFSRGKYIALLEGDDYWTDPHKLQQQLDFLELHNEYSGVFHDTMRYTEGDINEFKPWREHKNKLDFNLHDIISPLTQIHTSSFMFRKQNILKLPEFFLNTQSGDIPLFVLSALYGPFRRIPEFMSVYRKNSLSMTNSPQTRGYNLNLYRIQMHRWLLNYLGGKESNQFKKVIQWHRSAFAKTFANSNNKWKAFKIIFDRLEIYDSVMLLFHIISFRISKLISNMKHS